VSGPASVVLREPVPGDLDAMLALVAACDETWREWTPADWEPPSPESARWVSQLGAADRWTRLAVEPDGRLAGLVSWGAARGGPEWRTVPGTAHLSALFVHPDRWRRGVASLLLRAAMAAMREDGFVRARLNTPEGAPAERFYAAHGWRRSEGSRWHAVVQLQSVEYTIELGAVTPRDPAAPGGVTAGP
jgi:GNAT superfamily N-acetyltransferase